MRMHVSQLSICEISDLDRYIGDFVVSEIWESDIEAFRLIPMSVASESDATNGILTFADYLGEKAVIDVLNPMRFYQTQISAVLGQVTDSAVIELLARKRHRMSSKLSRKAA